MVSVLLLQMLGHAGEEGRVAVLQEAGILPEERGCQPRTTGPGVLGPKPRAELVASWTPARYARSKCTVSGEKRRPAECLLRQCLNR